VDLSARKTAVLNVKLVNFFFAARFVLAVLLAGCFFFFSCCDRYFGAFIFAVLAGRK
jgi:hypothetical protein